MTILCGFDFSASSVRAAEVAVGLASRLKTSLHLIHVLTPWPDNMLMDEHARVVAATQRAMKMQANTLHPGNLDISVHVAVSHSNEALLTAAKELGATLLVVGATGRGEARGRRVGSTADRLAQQSKVPTLVVRGVEAWSAWLRGERPLKVVVGVDSSALSEAAWVWARDLSKIAPVELVGANLYWPPYEFQRLGLTGPRSYIDGDPEVEKVLRHELEPLCRPGPNATSRLRLEPSLGRPADRLALLAGEEQADLVVVGSHSRSAIARLWDRSVSRGVLHESSGAVACIPLAAPSRQPGMGVHTVVVATDFSPAGNAAIAQAAEHVAKGGKVHIVHVVHPRTPRGPGEIRDVMAASPGTEQGHAEVKEKLTALASERGPEAAATEVLVLESSEPAAAIAQCAERLGADLICLGTRGGSGLAKTLLGSVVQGVLSLTQRPVLLVREPKA